MSQCARGSLSTGIMEAASTSDKRKQLPLSAPGSSSHAGFRKNAPSRIAPQTPTAGKSRNTLVAMAPPRMRTTMSTRTQSIRASPFSSLWTA